MRRYQDGGLAAMDEDDEDFMGIGGDDMEVEPGGAITSTGGLAALDIPGAAEAFQLMQKSSADARKALQDARASIMARKYGRSDALLAAAAALGAPTRTGSTAESFGAMAGALREPLAARRAFEMQQQKDLLGVNTQLAGLDEREATARLALAQLRAKLAAQGMNAPLEKVVVEGKTNPVGMTRAEARGKELYVPPVPAGFTVIQQPQPDGTVTPTLVNTKTGAVAPAGPGYEPKEGYVVFQQPQADGTTIPKRLNTKTGEITDAGAPYVPPRLSAPGRVQAMGKLQTIQILKRQLADMREKWKPLEDSISAGKWQGWMPTEAGSNFDKAVAAARGTIRQLTRVPGEGSMSDYEGRLDQAKLPDRNDYESSNTQAMDQLEEMLADYERTTKEMLGQTNTLKFDKTGKRTQ